MGSFYQTKSSIWAGLGRLFGLEWNEFLVLRVAFSLGMVIERGKNNVVNTVFLQIVSAETILF